MLKFFVGVAPPFQSYLKLESLSSKIKKKHAATPNISDGRSKSLNLRGRGVWIGGVGGVNSTLAYQTQGLQSHDGFVGLQGVLFDQTP